MSTSLIDGLVDLYEEDETAWLEQMAALIDQQRFAELDFSNLREFLLDMSRRDKREVLSRLTLLLTHRLKWEHQPGKRSASWESTIAVQRREILQLLESGVLLRNYAEQVLEKAYQQAVEQAAIECGLEESAFPIANSRSLEHWLAK